jgi:hypothetical protein
VDFKSPAEKRVEDFLDQQLSWVRKALHGQPLSWEETSAFQQPGGFEVLGKARHEYLQLLQQCPAKLSEYRKLQGRLAVKSVLSSLPLVPPGAPRQDAVAREAEELQRAGMSQPEIARTLNRRYPNRKDRKGNKHAFTAEAVRKMLARRRREATPDKT